MEHQQTIGQWLGEIQANGGLLILGVIFVVLGILFWMYAAITVASIRAEIKIVDKKVDEVDEKNKFRFSDHNKYMHLEDGTPIKLDLTNMLKKEKDRREASGKWTGEERRVA
jgi:hypothetical protein